MVKRALSAGGGALATLVLATVVCACGGGNVPTSPRTSTAPTVSQTPPPSAVPSATGGEVATLTAAEGGSTIDVRVNADIRVTLTADPGTTWTAPGVDGGTILKAVSSSVSAAGAIAEFRALQPGTARLSATENPTCLPLCGRPSRLWEVTVTVTPHPVP